MGVDQLPSDLREMCPTKLQTILLTASAQDSTCAFLICSRAILQASCYSFRAQSKIDSLTTVFRTPIKALWGPYL